MSTPATTPGYFGSYIDRLVAELTASYPVKREMWVHQQIRMWQAFRASDRDLLRPTRWARDHDDGYRNYMVDPLGERVPYVWADLLFGEEPVISPAATAAETAPPAGDTAPKEPGTNPDQDRLDDMINYNSLPSKLHWAEWICASEGEVWSRVCPNPLTQHADIEWHSRLSVTPLFIGQQEQPVAAAFVSVLDMDKNAVWRYVEVHTKGSVRRMLYKGSPNGNTLGQEVPLTARPETEAWDRQWDHGLEMLACRIYNKLDHNLHFGTSEYSGIQDLLLALNEATTVGQENMRLTAKQRAIIPQRFLNMAGNFPRGQEIIVATEVDQDPDKIKNEIAMVEFTFDAKALIAYLDSLTDTILTRGRIAPQLVGRHTEGAQTGPALRARLLDSELAAQGKGKPWDDEGPRIIRRAAQVENLETAKGGLGIGWTEVTKNFTFKRKSSLPEDPESLTRRLAISVNAEILSRKTAIQEGHPEWDADRVQAEIDQIILEVGSGVIPPESSITNPDRPSTVNPSSTVPNPQSTTKAPVGKALAPSAATAPDKAERSVYPNGKR